MAFTVYTHDTEHDRLEYGDEDRFWFHGGVLVVDSKTHGVRYYAPGHWQELHVDSHPGELRPAPPS
ncbi:hypothetical protein [Nocardia iowensis]|uniref:Uncharacterized protein n=1 Tax=Nocardia iowensis TaxID=204891 RepID=A0ABX8S133_NOCIO|nr:hypothetical protein [Nocardia iowensis]QXN94290.1 hypothetical protein KV110_15255 [Nocardia iowensis]